MFYDKSYIVYSIEWQVRIPGCLHYVVLRRNDFSIGNACIGVTHSADVFYHLAMTAGAAVLLDRTGAIVTGIWKSRLAIAHAVVLALRLGVGIVDVALLVEIQQTSGPCVYGENSFASISTL